MKGTYRKNVLQYLSIDVNNKLSPSKKLPSHLTTLQDDTLPEETAFTAQGKFDDSKKILLPHKAFNISIKKINSSRRIYTGL